MHCHAHTLTHTHTHTHTPYFKSLTFYFSISTISGGIGSGIAVLGTLLYSLAKRQYAKKGASGH